MRWILDLLEKTWFRDIYGYPVWGWLIFFAIVVIVIYGVILGMGDGRCNEWGCYPEF